jgi:ribosomal protein S18 acetylase RimI-like enzyme
LTDADFEVYFDLRWRVLRAPWGHPRESARDEFEDHAEHAAVRNGDGTIVGVARAHLIDVDEAQVRFMAVEESHRQQGVGSALLAYLEQAVRGRGAKRIVLNSREGVVRFYEKLGYRVVGEGPILFEKLRHKRMAKDLSAGD